MPQKLSWSKQKHLSTELLSVYSLYKRLQEWSLHCLGVMITHRLESQAVRCTCGHCVLEGFEADTVGQFRCNAKGSPNVTLKVVHSFLLTNLSTKEPFQIKSLSYSALWNMTENAESAHSSSLADGGNYQFTWGVFSQCLLESPLLSRRMLDRKQKSLGVKDDLRKHFESTSSVN